MNPRPEEIVRPLGWEEMSFDQRSSYDPRQRRLDDLPTVHCEYDPLDRGDRELPSFHRDE